MNTFRISVDSFLNGDHDSLWTIGNLPYYKALMQYNRDQGVWPGHYTMCIHNGVFISPEGEPMLWLAENVNLKDFLLNPPNFPYGFDDANGILAEQDPSIFELPDVNPVPFDYFQKTKNTFLESLAKKRRWKVRKELEKEKALDLRIIPVKNYDSEMLLLNETRVKELNGSDPTDLHCIPDAINLISQPVHHFRLEDNKGMCGAATVIETEPNTFYGITYHSIRPSVYTFTQTMIDENFNVPQMRFHYGSALDADGTPYPAYYYKKNISNKVMTVPFIDCISGREHLYESED